MQDELNTTPHSVTKVAPAKVWRTRNGQDADLHQFVRMRNTQAAEKTVETSTERLGKPLRVNDRVRIALVAISSRARKEGLIRQEVGDRGRVLLISKILGGAKRRCDFNLFF